MRLSSVIESVFSLVDLPLRLTENSKHKSVRVVGVVAFAVGFFPCMMIAILVGGLLSVPAMIQDA